MNNKNLKIYTNKIKALFNTIKYVKNWKHLLMLNYGFKHSIDIKLRSGSIINSVTKSDFIYPSVFIEYGMFTEKGGEIFKENDNIFVKIGDNKFKVLNLMSGVYEINEVFVNDEYSKFDFKNKVIIDVGAFLGDTSIFFASKGAKKIYAFEPNKELYDLLSYNITLNHLNNTIKECNKGIGDKKGKLDFFVGNAHGGGSIFDSKIKSEKKKITIDILSITDLLEKTGEIDILKLDCEGSEYPILESLIKNNLAHKIKEGIILEAHFIDNKRNPEYAKELVKKLKFKNVNIKYNPNAAIAIIWGQK